MQINEYSQPIAPFDSQAPVPMQLMMSVMDSKSKLLERNVSALQNNVDAFGQLDVARDYDKAVLGNKVNELVGKINSFGAQEDLADPVIFSGINSLRSTITKDKQLINALAQTKLLRKEQELAEDARKSGKDWAQQNENYLSRRINQYLQSTDELGKFTGKWMPYYDINTDFQSAVDKIKANGTWKDKMDGTYGYFQETGEELTGDRIRQYLSDRISSDARVRQQMAIDSEDMYTNAPDSNLLRGYAPLLSAKARSTEQSISSLSLEMDNLKADPAFLTSPDKQAAYKRLTELQGNYKEQLTGYNDMMERPDQLAASIMKNREQYGMEIYQSDLVNRYVDQFAYRKFKLEKLAGEPTGKGSHHNSKGTGTSDPYLNTAISWDAAKDDGTAENNEDQLRSDIVDANRQIRSAKQKVISELQQETGKKYSEAEINSWMDGQERLLQAGKQITPEYENVRGEIMAAKTRAATAQSIISDVNNSAGEQIKAHKSYPVYKQAKEGYAADLQHLSGYMNQTFGTSFDSYDMGAFMNLYDKYAAVQTGSYGRTDKWSPKLFLDNLANDKNLKQSTNPVVGMIRSMGSEKALQLLGRPDAVLSDVVTGHGLANLLARKGDIDRFETNEVGDIKNKLYESRYSYVSQVPFRSVDYLLDPSKGGDTDIKATLRTLIRQHATEGNAAMGEAVDDNKIIPRAIGNNSNGDFFIQYEVSGTDSKVHTVKVSKERSRVDIPGITDDRYPQYTNALLQQGYTMKADEPDIQGNAILLPVPVAAPGKALAKNYMYVRLYNANKPPDGSMAPQSDLDIIVQVMPATGPKTWTTLRNPSTGEKFRAKTVEQALTTTQQYFSGAMSAQVNPVAPIQ